MLWDFFQPFRSQTRQLSQPVLWGSSVLGLQKVPPKFPKIPWDCWARSLRVFRQGSPKSLQTSNSLTEGSPLSQSLVSSEGPAKLPARVPQGPSLETVLAEVLDGYKTVPHEVLAIRVPLGLPFPCGSPEWTPKATQHWVRLMSGDSWQCAWFNVVGICFGANFAQLKELPSLEGRYPVTTIKDQKLGRWLENSVWVLALVES